jgi:hypothetical protein
MHMRGTQTDREAEIYALSILVPRLCVLGTQYLCVLYTMVRTL